MVDANIILTHNGPGYKIKFKGRRMQTPKGVRYNSFRGIPYAQPPIGDLRFRDTKPIEYEGMAYVNATEYSMPCSQIDLTKTDELKVRSTVRRINVFFFKFWLSLFFCRTDS